MMRAAASICILVLSAGAARAATREEALVCARAYAYHPWRSSAANQSASCSASYQSLFPPGDYLGLPYDWGGYMSLFEFDNQIAAGYGAGSQETDGILSCTAGVDCSGFVSRCWESGHYTTSTVDQTAAAITKTQLLPGDILNKAGYHMAMFSHLLANGEPVFYESVGYNVHINVNGGWSYVSGYTPRRHSAIQGTSVTDPVGTAVKPIVIPSFPYTDSRDTRQSPSDVLDGCGAAPATNESGPEYVYQVIFTQPGQLTATVSDDASTDVDVHIYTSMNTRDCIARGDSTLTQPVDCGTYYVVADTFRNSGGQDLAGAYTLTAAFTPSGQPCGAGPPKYNPKGGLGDPCAYPGHTNLPFCNPNLGGDTCIYSSQGSGGSFCSKPCQTSQDCADVPGGACCSDLGNNELYCLVASWCKPGEVTDMTASESPADGGENEGPTEEPSENPPARKGSCAFADSPAPSACFPLLVAIVITLRLGSRGRANNGRS